MCVKTKTVDGLAHTYIYPFLLFFIKYPDVEGLFLFCAYIE